MSDWNRPEPRGAKLSARQVRDIKYWLAAGQSQSSLARKHGVSRSCINDLKRGKTWSWVETTKGEWRDLEPVMREA